MYIDAYNSTVKYGPGDQTHFEVLLRQGLTDLGVINRGVSENYYALEHGHHVQLVGAQ